MKSLRRIIRNYRETRTAEIELGRYSDSELRDLGISRGGIRAAVRNGRSTGMDY